MVCWRWSIFGSCGWGTHSHVQCVYSQGRSFVGTRKAQYLANLAKGLGILPQLANQMLDKFGVAKIFA